MKVSVDISLYPLKKEFEKEIIDFILKLRQTNFKIIETDLSTQVYGDYNEVMSWIQENIKESFLIEENAVFVLKIINGDRSKYGRDY